MHKTPNAERIHIVLVGLRNSGKSSLLNALVEKEVAIVSDKPGTTTDPVMKQYEILPLGPVTFIDTAGFDDYEEMIGEKRVEKTLKAVNSSDVILFVARSDSVLSENELEKIAEFKKKGKLIIAVFTHCKGVYNTNSESSLVAKKRSRDLHNDLYTQDETSNKSKQKNFNNDQSNGSDTASNNKKPTAYDTEELKKHLWTDDKGGNNTTDYSVLDVNKKVLEHFEIPYFHVDSPTKYGIEELKKYLSHLSIAHEITPVEGLVTDRDFVILVAPIDSAAPKGRLILPQVETIRDLLDNNCGVLVVKETELKFFYDSLGIKPKLVITDSQAFQRVSSDIPLSQPLTSFSILFARKKGDFDEYIKGLKALSDVPDNAEVLILESCSHHRQKDDIGTIKIPKLFKEKINATAQFTFLREIPNDIEIAKYHVIIQCGSCMITRTQNMDRIETIKKYGIKVINYGMFLAWVNGLIPRALEPIIRKDLIAQDI